MCDQIPCQESGNITNYYNRNQFYDGSDQEQSVVIKKRMGCYDEDFVS